MNQWTIERLDESCVRLSSAFSAEAPTPTALLLSDPHFDSAQCNRNLFTRHLKQATEAGAPVIICGDFFDAMQGKWDKRSSWSSIRPEHHGEDYLDRLVSTAAEYLEPFAKSIHLISYGNHETSIIKRHQVDLIQRLAQELKRMGSPVMVGTYSGAVQFRFSLTPYTKSKKAAGQQASALMAYHHGYGGGGEVTRGLIDNNRTRSQVHADIYLSGHIHRRNLDDNLIRTWTIHGKPMLKRQLFLRASTYKREWHGWATEKGMGPRPLGGWWLEFSRHVSGGDPPLHPRLVSTHDRWVLKCSSLTCGNPQTTIAATPPSASSAAATAGDYHPPLSLIPSTAPTRAPLREHSAPHRSMSSPEKCPSPCSTISPAAAGQLSS